MKAQQIIEQNRHLWVSSLSANKGLKDLIADDNVEAIESLNSGCCAGYSDRSSHAGLCTCA